MTDRELLEAAAKAAGYTSHGYGELVGNSPFLWLREADFTGMWAPLTDDGDALRVAVKLGISLEQEANIEVDRDTFGGEYKQGVDAWKVHRDASSTSAKEVYSNDPYAATRRAIVRAAAEIGAAIGGAK